MAKVNRELLLVCLDLKLIMEDYDIDKVESESYKRLKKVIDLAESKEVIRGGLPKE